MIPNAGPAIPDLTHRNHYSEGAEIFGFSLSIKGTAIVKVELQLLLFFLRRYPGRKNHRFQTLRTARWPAKLRLPCFPALLNSPQATELSNRLPADRKIMSVLQPSRDPGIGSGLRTHLGDLVASFRLPGNFGWVVDEVK